ncbi:MAG TPA: hypothetical protein P5512_01835 [Chitinophagales bacterium]|nr:hypothetical protein [Chitinophagales bacterium]
MTDQSYSFRLPGFSSALPFLAAILGFFLVFTEVDCNGTTMISMSGYDLVTGDRQDPDTGTKEQEDPNIWAIISLGAAALGLILFGITKRRFRWWSMAAMGLIGLLAMWQLHRDVEQSIHAGLDAKSDGDKVDMDLDIGIHFRIGYWIVLGCFGLATLWNITMARRSGMLPLPVEEKKSD